MPGKLTESGPWRPYAFTLSWRVGFRSEPGKFRVRESSLPDTARPPFTPPRGLPALARHAPPTP
ncbi:hypothetical protein STTU_5194 [Streptomyces sp. Tu6071]|nr:hypothetical protein STTU_5194 [Streptomyces sp. Tu6071]